MFIGISLLSVFEIVEFWIDFLSNLVMRKMDSQKKASDILKNIFQIICANALLYSELACKKMVNETFYLNEGNFKISEEVNMKIVIE